MTPEELAAYREWVRISNFESNTWPPMGLLHIDQQAAQIAELETRIDLLQNELFEMLKGKDAQEVISELMTRIDNQTVRISELEVDLEKERYNSEAFMNKIGEQACYTVDLENQIKALKKIAVEGWARERTGGLMWPGAPDSMKSLYRVEARRQLAKKYPEIFRI